MADPITKVFKEPDLKSGEIIRLEVPLQDVLGEAFFQNENPTEDNLYRIGPLLDGTRLEISARESSGFLGEVTQGAFMADQYLQDPLRMSQRLKTVDFDGALSIANNLGKININEDRFMADLRLSPVNVSYDDQNGIMEIHYDSSQKPLLPIVGLGAHLLAETKLTTDAKYDFETERLLDIGIGLDHPLGQGSFSISEEGSELSINPANAVRGIKYRLKYFDQAGEPDLIGIDLAKKQGALSLAFSPDGKICKLHGAFPVDKAVFNTSTFFSAESIGQSCGMRYQSPLGEVSFELDCNRTGKSDDLNFGGSLFIDLRR